MKAEDMGEENEMIRGGTRNLKEFIWTIDTKKDVEDRIVN